jgi:polar amino acid transport system substrate-binding protein
MDKIWHWFVQVASIAVLSIAALTASSAAYATEPVARLITVEEPPASFNNSEQQPEGFVVDLVQALQRHLADSSPIELMPEGRAMLTAEQDSNVLLFSFSRTPEREARYHWLLPVLRKNWQIYQLPQQRRVLKNLADLRKLSAIGVVRGDVRETFLIQQGFTNLVAVTNHQQNLQLLQSGRVEAIASDSLELAYLLRQQPSESLVPELLPKLAMTLSSSDAYLMMPKTAAPALVLRWQQAILALQRNGELAAIASKWQQRIEQELQQKVQRKDHLLLF